MLSPTILCQDFLEVDLPRSFFDIACVDPPYNYDKDYGPNTDDNREPTKYWAWYAAVAARTHALLNTGYVYVSCGPNQVWDVRPRWEQAGFDFITMLIWHGPNFGSNPNRNNKVKWRLLYEPILLFKKNDPPPFVNSPVYYGDAVLRFARPQSNYNGLQEKIHPTQKPVSVYEALLSRTPGQWLLDPFMGSGAAGLAAEKLGLSWVEINPEFCAASRERLRILREDIGD